MASAPRSPADDPRPARRLAITAACLAAAIGVGASTAHAETITAIGNGQATVTPKDPRNEASIQAAVRSSTRMAIPRALLNARAQAALIGEASGLSLGPIESVEQQFSQFTPYFGRFGPNRFCGTVPRRVRVPDGEDRRRFVVRGTRRQCRAPDFTTVTLQVTFAAAPGS